MILFGLGLLGAAGVHQKKIKKKLYLKRKTLGKKLFPGIDLSYPVDT